MKILFIVFTILVIASLIYLNAYISIRKNANTIEKLLSYLALVILIITTVFMFHLGVKFGVIYFNILVIIFAYIYAIKEKIQGKEKHINFELYVLVTFLIFILIFAIMTVPLIETKTKVSNETINLQSYNLNSNLCFALIELNEKGEYCVRDTLNQMPIHIAFEDIESINKVKSDEKIVRHKYTQNKDSLISYFGFCDSEYITYEKYTVYLIY